MAPADIRRVGVLYRMAAADLAVARRRFPGDPVTARLDLLVRSAQANVYAHDRRGPGVMRFFTKTYWERLRERPWILVASLLCLFAPWILASIWAVRDPVAAMGLAPAGTQSVIERPSADFGLSADEKVGTATAILTNNIRVAIMAFAAGIAVAVGSGLVLIYQGVVLGATFGLTIEAGNGSVLWEFVIPHGVLELSCIVAAGVGGMRMGWALVSPGHRTRMQALQAEARPATEIVVGTAAWLVVAGLIEGIISTSGIGIGAGLVIGVGIGLFFWTMVLVRGRPSVFVARQMDAMVAEIPTRPLSVA